MPVDVSVWVTIAATAALYAAGVRRRHHRGARRPGSGGIAAMFIALALLGLALADPMDRLADALFWVHMVQHMMLVTVVAPLIVLGAPTLALGEVLSTRWRSASAHVVAGMAGPRGSARAMAAVALGLAILALVAWHVPVLFEAALRHDAIHALEHLTLLATALVLWWFVLDRASRVAVGSWIAVVIVIAYGTVMMALGAVLAFAPVAIYAAYGPTEAARGISAIGDQQAAGLIMWIPAGLVNLAAIAWVFLRALEDDDRAARRSDLRRSDHSRLTADPAAPAPGWQG